MAVNTILPEAILNPRQYSTLRDSNSITAASEVILKAHQVAGAATIAEGTASAGESTAAALLQITRGALLETLQAESLSGTITADDAIARVNPAATNMLITYNVTIDGTAVKADIDAIVLDYTNALALGADVDASVMSDAILALGTVSAVNTFELSLDVDPTGETIDLTIGAAEIAYTVEASISFTDDD